MNPTSTETVPVIPRTENINKDQLQLTYNPEGTEEKQSKNCCDNCSMLMAKLSECEICTNPLQNSGVVACFRCGGFWCGSCARHLVKCPYCRAPPPRQLSKAFGRLLNDLSLPCRNQRWGCNVVLTSSTRRDHECSCPHRQIICPVNDRCGSCLPLEEMKSHITNSHDLIAFSVEKINVVIEHFDTKMAQTAMLRHKYKLCLLAHGAAFVLKVSLFNYKINLSISQKHLRYEVEPEGAAACAKKPSFCALLEFHSRDFATRTAVMLSERGCNKNTIISKRQYDSKSWMGDKASVCITINPISGD